MLKRIDLLLIILINIVCVVESQVDLLEDNNNGANSSSNSTKTYYFIDKQTGKTHQVHCNSLECDSNCDINLCLDSKQSRKMHYIITCVIMSCVIILILVTIHACHKESKRNRMRWRFSQQHGHYQPTRLFMFDSSNHSHSSNINQDSILIPMRTLNCTTNSHAHLNHTRNRTTNRLLLNGAPISAHEVLPLRSIQYPPPYDHVHHDHHVHANDSPPPDYIQATSSTITHRNENQT